MDPLDIENEIHERVVRLTKKIDQLAVENIRLTAELRKKTMPEEEAYRLGQVDLKARHKNEINRLTEELKSKDEEIQRLNELVFAYESVRAPINPLIAENKALTEQIARKEKALAVAIKYIGESSSDELAAQYDIKQALKGDTP